jgi:hypothetical protein
VVAKPVGDEGKSYQEAFRPIGRWESSLGFHRNAIAAQQFGGNDNGRCLTGRDGISKTAVWRK